jgi:hypothetical protein
MRQEQTGLFDAPEAELRKAAGLAQVYRHNETWVSIARRCAESIAREHGTVTADEVRNVLYPLGYIPRHPNAWGAVFKGTQFEWTGEWIKSRIPERHGNNIRVWRLRRA